MKKLFVVLALSLAVSGVAFADGAGGGVQGPNAQMIQRTRTVYNDSGGDLTSGTIVVWDNDDTEFDRTGYPYVTTVATNGSAYVAGVVLNPNCVSGNTCEIVTEGWARVNIAHSTAAATEDATVSTSTVAGQAGDWDAGAGECYLGTVLELFSLDTQATAASANLIPMPVYVHIGCDDT